jgi:hypothetical protein
MAGLLGFGRPAIPSHLQRLGQTRLDIRSCLRGWSGLGCRAKPSFNRPNTPSRKIQTLLLSRWFLVSPLTSMCGLGYLFDRSIKVLLGLVGFQFAGGFAELVDLLFRFRFRQPKRLFGDLRCITGLHSGTTSLSPSIRGLSLTGLGEAIAHGGCHGRRQVQAWSRNTKHGSTVAKTMKSGTS